MSVFFFSLGQHLVSSVGVLLDAITNGLELLLGGCSRSKTVSAVTQLSSVAGSLGQGPSSALTGRCETCRDGMTKEGITSDSRGGGLLGRWAP